MISVQEHIKTVGDAVSISTVCATFLGWLPHLAAALSIIWTGIRIYETKTVQRLLGKETKDGDISKHGFFPD